MLVASTIPGHKLRLDTFLGFDKVLHIIEYIIFSFLFINAIKNPNMHKIIVIILIGIIYGAINEFWQLFLAERSASFYDGVANSIGMVIGSIITNKYLICSNDK